jgi:hypothetical protein
MFFGESPVPADKWFLCGMYGEDELNRPVSPRFYLNPGASVCFLSLEKPLPGFGNPGRRQAAGENFNTGLVKMPFSGAE